MSTDNQLSGYLDSDILDFVAQRITNDWDRLGRRLGVEDHVIEQIDLDEGKVARKAYAVLSSWKKSSLHSLTWHEFKSALERISRRDVIRDVEAEYPKLLSIDNDSKVDSSKSQKNANTGDEKVRSPSDIPANLETVYFCKLNLGLEDLTEFLYSILHNQQYIDNTYAGLPEDGNLLYELMSVFIQHIPNKAKKFFGTEQLELLCPSDDSQTTDSKKWDVTLIFAIVKTWAKISEGIPVLQHYLQLSPHLLQIVDDIRVQRNKVKHTRLRDLQKKTQFDPLWNELRNILINGNYHKLSEFDALGSGTLLQTDATKAFEMAQVKLESDVVNFDNEIIDLIRIQQDNLNKALSSNFDKCNELSKHLWVKMSKLNGMINQVSDQFIKMEGRIDDLEEKADIVKEKVGNMEKKVGHVEEIFINVEKKVAEVEEIASNVEEKVDGMGEKVGNVEKKLDEMKEKLDETFNSLNNSRDDSQADSLVQMKNIDVNSNKLTQLSLYRLLKNLTPESKVKEINFSFNEFVNEHFVEISSSEINDKKVVGSLYLYTKEESIDISQILTIAAKVTKKPVGVSKHHKKLLPK